MRDPFAPIVRRKRFRAQLMAAQRMLLRPVRPSRRRSASNGPANLVLIGVDTMRGDHRRPELTPRLCDLSASGVDLRDVTAPAPWTLPSFSSALTGLMPTLHGAVLSGRVRNMDQQPPQRLGTDALTLARHLARQGYATAAFYANQFFGFGLAESFDEHRYLNLPAADMLAVAADWIRRHADRPVFCFVLLNDPHEPTTPPVDLLERELRPLDLPTPSRRELRFLAAWGDPDQPAGHLGTCGWPLNDTAKRARTLKSAIYRATISAIDRSIGRFHDQLDRWRLADHTLFSVFSDHGEEFCDHAAEAHGWDHDPRQMRGIGHGHTQFQELLHVPWLAWGAGGPQVADPDAPVSLCDLAPTLTDWLEVDPLPLPITALSGLVGRSLASQAPDPDRLLLAEALAFGPDIVALRRGRWKLIAQRDGRPLGLYDLDGDPRERDDRQHADPDRLRSLQDDLTAWRDAAPSMPKSGDGDGGDDRNGWSSMEDEVRQRLKDLGYGE